MPEHEHRESVAARPLPADTARRRPTTPLRRPPPDDRLAWEHAPRAAIVDAASGAGSRIVRSTVDGPSVTVGRAGQTRIQRRVVNRPAGESLPASELDRIRVAVERGPDAERQTLRLAHFVDDTREWTFHQVVEELGLDEHSLPSALEAAVARGHRPGFEFTKSVKYRNDDWTMSFERDQTELDADESHKPVRLVKDNDLQIAVVIRGYRSEDERPVIARDRADAVRKALVSAGYTSKATIDPVSEGTKGNFDYREMRRVEVRPQDEDKPDKLDDGRVLSTDPRYKNYGMKASLDGGEKLLDGAIGRLSSINASTPPSHPVMQIFRRFFTTADPAAIVANLQLTRAQIVHYRPEAPADASAAAGGHACLDESRPGLFYLNQDTGPEARMIAGVLSLTATPGAKAYNIVHEATHGAPALATRDYAYRWQRLFTFLSPELQVKNADSYAMLVGTLESLTEAQPGMTEKESDKYDMPAAADTAVATEGLSPEMESALAATWAWLQHYTTQVYLNFRDVYPNVAAGATPAPTSYQGQLYAIAADVFGLGPGEFATIAGIIDRLDDLNMYANNYVPYYSAAQPVKDPGDPYFVIMLPRGLPADPRAVMRWQLDVMLHTVDTTRPMRSNYYALFLRVVPMSSWGGPLG